MTLNISESLAFGTVYELYITAGVVQDKYDNENEEEILRFRTNYVNSNPMVISTSPSNGQTGVSVNK